jgi:hypothetical protein
LKLIDYSIIGANPSVNRILKIENDIIWYVVNHLDNNLNDGDKDIRKIFFNDTYKKTL